jgi:hypothetical protein
MRRLLFLVLLVPSVLAAQREPGERGRPPEPFYEDTGGPAARRAYGFGVVGYTGGMWQPSGVEFAMLWRLGPSAQTSAGAWVMLGSFTQDQAVYFGRSQGFFAALGLTARQPLLTLAEVGSERNPSYIRLEVAADLGWSADFDSPLAQGPWDGRAALLGGFSFGSGSPMGQTIYIMYGPAALMGRTTTTHGQFALRFRMPIRPR